MMVCYCPAWAYFNRLGFCQLRRCIAHRAGFRRLVIACLIIQIVIIAIDGPAGSGKSSTAKAVALRLGFEYLDTGAMYRAVALHLLHLGATVDNADLAGILRSFDLDVVKVGGNARVMANGSDVTEEIRTPEVGTMASRISSNGAIRAWMVDRQRSTAASMSSSGGIVVEGRDIGTVVFPDADLKVYMDARDEIRAERRLEELRRQGVSWSLAAVRRDLAERDARDLQREIAPLRRADDALVIDTSSLSFEQQVEQIVAAVHAVRSVR